MLTAITADRLRRRSVPGHGAFGRYGDAVNTAGLVGSDEVREYELEGRVVEAVDVDLGAGEDLRRGGLVYVARLPIVIPYA